LPDVTHNAGPWAGIVVSGIRIAVLMSRSRRKVDNRPRSGRQRL